ncbi:MAG: PilZ domain-containing protein, partial [Planctomycetota bacterium]
MYHGPERRKRKRYGVKGSTLSYKKSFFGSYSDLYLMLNTSETGFMFITREPLALHKTISCHLRFEELDGSIPVKGKVIW